MADLVVGVGEALAVAEGPGVGDLLAGADAFDGGAERDLLTWFDLERRRRRFYPQLHAFAEDDPQALRRLEAVAGVEVFGPAAGADEAGAGGGCVDDRRTFGEGAGIKGLVAAEQDRAAAGALDFEVGEAEGVGAGGLEDRSQREPGHGPAALAGGRAQQVGAVDDIGAGERFQRQWPLLAAGTDDGDLGGVGARLAGARGQQRQRQ